MNIAIITLDSLRFDSSQVANTPNINKLLTGNKETRGWIKVGAQATYTLLAHLSIFHSGILPCDNRDPVDGPYNRLKQILFRPQLAWRERDDILYPTPEAPNIVKGFERIGYRTVGIGGVHWFNNKFETSSFWKDLYFSEFYWEADWSDPNPNCFLNQVPFVEKLLKDHNVCDNKKPLFFFMNIAATHTPYMGNEVTPQGQAKCLEHIDESIMKIIDNLPKPCHLVIMADHGDCMGEDGLYGHAFYHPKVMEIPMKSMVLES